MGQTTILTSYQNNLLTQLGKYKWAAETFYFSGGTALSEFYLHHRISDDLDFFADNVFDPSTLTSVITEIGHKFNFTISPEFVDPTHIFILKYPNNDTLKIDFTRYPFKNLEERLKTKFKIQVDSLLDIAANKLLSITQRSEVKDFVDLYYLLKRYTFWDLKTAVRAKFSVEIEPYIMASEFLSVESFDYFPKMYLPLNMVQLKAFFRNLAKELASPLVK